jgi:hypothetical protein
LDMVGMPDSPMRRNGHRKKSAALHVNIFVPESSTLCVSPGKNIYIFAVIYIPSDKGVYDVYTYFTVIRLLEVRCKCWC